MSTRKKPRNFIQRLLKRIWQSFNALIKGLTNGVLRSLMVFKRRSRQSQAGFVLPTVVMVMLVVALLTTAIVIRSFDRAKNASNIRVDQAVLNAATPALDRARAKLERLFSAEENRLSGNPPPEGSSYDEVGTISYVLSQNEYTFGDETPLKVAFDIDGNGIEKKDQLKTAWKFPTDTDNDGRFDTFTLYGIYFRNPSTNRARQPLEARALPQATGIGNACAAGDDGASSFQQNQGWYETDGQLKKAFFTYVANVPISQADIDKIPTVQQAKYQVYQGNKSFSALEMQQDQGRIALDNNAVWYKDDLVISNVPPFNLNGRIHTNSNLMVANTDNDKITLWQVSSLNSCFYTAENAKIIVGGHVAAGDITGDSDGGAGDSGNNLVEIHLYQGTGTRPDQNNQQYVNNDNKTTDFNPAEIASNSNAYEARLNLLVNAAIAEFKAQYPTGDYTNVGNFNRFPPEVISTFNSKYDADDPGSGESILRQVLKTYFADRIRIVSYKEVPPGADPLAPLAQGASPFAGGGVMVPPLEWMRYDTADPTVLPVKTSGGGIELEATNPNELPGTGSSKEEERIGDRIQVGNSLPRRWLKEDNTTYATANEEQEIAVNVNWNAGGGKRTREGLVEQLDDLGDTSRGGYWERAAALSGKEFEDPSIKELAGGLRVITGAGIYIDGIPVAQGGTGIRESQYVAGISPELPKSFLPTPPASTALELKQLAAKDERGIKLPPDIQNETNPANLTNYVVWPDTMPMFKWDDANNSNTYDAGEAKRGDLQMRATVVYHSAKTAGPDQEPIACIATLYDPTDPLRAQNVTGLPKVPDLENTELGTSLNGINYDATGLKALRASALSDLKLLRQANLLFPDGRWANKPLRDAVIKLRDKGVENLSVADTAAIDAANCAFRILNSPTAFITNSPVPNLAIQERTFLDARQVKALRKRDTKSVFNPTTNSFETQALTLAGGTPVTRETQWEYISDPDKLKIAELGELSLPATSAEYSLPIEQRQPLEIRVTQIDLDVLRQTQVQPAGGTGINNKDEYLLPNSGIIYASRNDAVPDITNFDPTTGEDAGSSATDFKLDPTRRPNGIRLVNGSNLARQNDYRIAEKGLILASDLPVYIKGEFNRHSKPGTTTVREEFTDLLLDDYTNFYTRQTLNKSFACRPSPDNAAACPDGGDQWRAARILSDAVTLLSSNFRDGYRNEGDYDLNNNAGNLAVESRLKNGFWWNYFATSSEWYGNDGFPKQGSSYVTNGVTPIQRRENFPEYKMEICRKLPVSACGPGDWTKDGAGTTAPYEDSDTSIRYVAIDDRRYPRRLAFRRNSFGEIEMPSCSADTPVDCKPIPIAVNGSSTVDVVYDGMTAYTGSTSTLPASVDNALWYWTTKDASNPSAATDTSTPIAALTSQPDVTYNGTGKLYYAPFDPEEVSERQLLLPGLPEFPLEMGIPSLNTQPTATTKTGAPSDYAIFTITDGEGCLTSQAYKPNDNNPTVGACPAADVVTEAVTAIVTAWDKLLNYTRPANVPLSVVSTNRLGDILTSLSLTYDPAQLTPVTLKAEAKVNIYDLPTSWPNNTELSNLAITLDGNNRIDSPIFVFRTPPGMTNLTIKDVNLTLEGVDPNNIFWVIRENLRIDNKPTLQIAGNFLSGNQYQTRPSRFSLSSTSKVNGGRFLGFSAAPSGQESTYMPTGTITAMTTAAQPLLIPMLNLHSPQGNPGNAPFGNGETITQTWIQRLQPAVTETYNAVLIMGDSPSRPFPGKTGVDSGESGGGLANFPRFLEAWNGSSTKISGGFIQFKNSIFATAPFEAIDDPQSDNSLFFDSPAFGQRPPYMGDFNAATTRPYIYKGGGQRQKAPYYFPPKRLWGYDVGLLSQAPDLFARRFSTPSAGVPNEYYREVSRDDKWVQTLLCAAEKNPPTTQGGQPTYDQWAISDPRQRPSSCQEPTPPAAKYSDL
ncbi:MAG: hormogonium polysaccharide biosynthesis protein HpsA [Cyanobacteriota bacterium]